MGRHLAVKKKLTVFDLRYYRYWVWVLWIKTKKRLKLKLIVWLNKKR
jgi:hypothetical protein